MAKFVARVALALVAILLVVSQTMVLAEATVQAKDGQFYNPASYGPGSLKSYQCGGQCQRRCSQTQYKKPCLFFCNKCCATCLCVPPGFYGNKQVCPCYNNWKTKEGGPKCP